MFAFGSIVLTRFPFTDLSETNVGPRWSYRATTTAAQTWWSASSPRCRARGPTWRLAATTGAGLKAPSVVRFDKLATLDRSVIAGKLGDAPAGWLAAHGRTFLSVFGFSAP